LSCRRSRIANASLVTPGPTTRVVRRSELLGRQRELVDEALADRVKQGVAGGWRVLGRAPGR
jgi:hypothetical protein